MSPPTSVELAAPRRCPSCERWGGVRRLGADGVAIQLDPANTLGRCNEGPWHGSLRGPRNACGQWKPWLEIAPAAESR